MTVYEDVASSHWTKAAPVPALGGMGSAERKLWSSFVRQSQIDRTIAALHDPNTYGVVVLGPWGVGKTTLARSVESTLGGSIHIERLFGSESETLVSYGSLPMLMARLPVSALDTPTGVIHGIDELIRGDAAGREVLLIVDDLPGLDTMTVGVLMHLVLGGTAKLLVMARDTGGLPEDFAWLLKDGQLGHIRLDYFSRAEVGELIAKATGTFVSETAVSALYEASNGIPLVLQALFRELVAKGGIRKHLGGWVISESINLGVGSELGEIVRSRLSRESAAIRLGIEKMSLLGDSPLQVAMSALGQDVLWQLEERGYIEIDFDGRERVFLTERYIGNLVRGGLPANRISDIFAEIAHTVRPELDSLDNRQKMSWAAWTLDAGMTLEPRFGLAAAVSALRHFDPMLALRCTANIPADHPLWSKAVEVRSLAFHMLADYEPAVAELESVSAARVSVLPIDDYARWVLASVGALLWVPGGDQRIQILLSDAKVRLDQVANGPTPSPAAKRAKLLVNLARFHYQVHRGEFASIVEELEAESRSEDTDYGLNCACLLVSTLSVVGRELDAIALGKRIATEISGLDAAPLFIDYARNGVADAQIWSGQWRDCVAEQRGEIEATHSPVPYRGGLIELNLGLAHAFAGRGTEAVQVLMSAAAQLEARNSDNALGLAYSALAFCHAQVNNEQEATHYLALAGASLGPTSWSNAFMGEFFRLLALRWLDDPRAVEMMRQQAKRDIEMGRHTTASISLFASSIQAADKEYALLEETSLKRQGPMARVNVLIARSCRSRNPDEALEAAEIAQSLGLEAVESRCAVLALDFAREAGKNSLARLATQRLERLNTHLPKLPLRPQSVGVKLTQREIQVAKLAKRGLGNRAIADRIGVSVRTVEGHLYQLYSKLGITTRTELAEDQDF